MFAVPRIEEVISRAAELGLHLDPDEAAVCQAVLSDRLARLDEFVQARLSEDRPPLLFSAREPGYRPSATEDPYNAWLWRCRIGGGDGMLMGKTVSFKDHIPVAGMPLTLGSFAMDDFIVDFDATVVTRVLAAGGTVIGKNVMNGFAGGKSSGAGVTLGDYWRPLNPHDIARITGGSSSGAGAAVAAGEVDIAFGGDQGGSIRIPSAYCGVVGLKATFGLISHMGLAFGSEQSVDHTGPIARRVEDVAAALEAVAGYDGFDPRQSRAVPERIDVTSRMHDGVRGLRIGLLEEGFDDPIEEAVRDGVLAALDVLADAGATVERVSVPLHRSVAAPYEALVLEGGDAIFNTGPFGMWSKTYYPPSVVAAMTELLDDHTDHLQPRTPLLRLLAAYARSNFSGVAYAKAQNVRPTFVRAYDTALERVDVLAMPTCRTVAPLAESGSEDRKTVTIANMERAGIPTPHIYNTSPFNYTGHPALAIPCGKVGHLPISLQLVGRFFDDPMLLRIAYAYQESVDWQRQLAIDDGPIGRVG